MSTYNRERYLRNRAERIRKQRVYYEAHRAERLAYHKVPGYVAIVDELPLSSTRKLARGEIKTLAAGAVSANRAIDMRGMKAKLRHA